MRGEGMQDREFCWPILGITLPWPLASGRRTRRKRRGAVAARFHARFVLSLLDMGSNREIEPVCRSLHVGLIQGVNRSAS